MDAILDCLSQAANGGRQFLSPVYRVDTGALPRLEELLYPVDEVQRGYWLWNIAIEPTGQNLVPVSNHGVGSNGDERYFSEGFVVLDPASDLIAIYSRHV